MQSILFALDLGVSKENSVLTYSAINSERATGFLRLAIQTLLIRNLHREEMSGHSATVLQISVSSPINAYSDLVLVTFTP